MSVVRRIARPMLATIFIAQGYSTLRDPKPLIPKAEAFAEKVGPALEKQAPAALTDPKTMVRINAGVQLAGGAALATGTFPRLASVVLAGSLVPTTWAGHPFWDADDPSVRSADRVQVMKNVGIAGGLLLSAADRKKRRRRKSKKSKKRPPTP